MKVTREKFDQEVEQALSDLEEGGPKDSRGDFLLALECMCEAMHIADGEKTWRGQDVLIDICAEIAAYMQRICARGGDIGECNDPFLLLPISFVGYMSARLQGDDESSRECSLMTFESAFAMANWEKVE